MKTKNWLTESSLLLTLIYQAIAMVLYRFFRSMFGVIVCHFTVQTNFSMIKVCNKDFPYDAYVIIDTQNV